MHLNAGQRPQFLTQVNVLNTTVIDHFWAQRTMFFPSKQSRKFHRIHIHFYFKQTMIETVLDLLSCTIN